MRYLKSLFTFLIVLLIVLIVFCAFHPDGFLHVIGALPRTPSSTENFWGGFASDIQEFVLIPAIFATFYHMYKRHNCREHGCWKIGFLEYIDKDGARHPVCKHHHPDPPHHNGKFSFVHLHEQKLRGKL